MVKDDQQVSTPDYSVGFSEEFMEALRRFTAHRSAAHLLPQPEAGPANTGLRLRAGHHIRRAGEGGGAGRAVRRGHGAVPNRDGERRRADERRRQREVPGRRRGGLALRGRLLRRRPLPLGPHARAGHAGRAGGGEAGAEARRRHQLPGGKRRVQFHPAGLRGDPEGVGHVRGPALRRRRTPADGQGPERDTCSTRGSPTSG